MTYDTLKARLERTERTLQGIEDFRQATYLPDLFVKAEKALVDMELKDLAMDCAVQDLADEVRKIRERSGE